MLHLSQKTINAIILILLGLNHKRKLLKDTHHYETSNYQVQEYNTELCGQLSLLVIYLISKGFDYEDIILVLKNRLEKFHSPEKLI